MKVADVLRKMDRIETAVRLVRTPDGKVSGYVKVGQELHKLACPACGYPDPGGAILKDLPCPNCA